MRDKRQDLETSVSSSLKRELIPYSFSEIDRWEELFIKQHSLVATRWDEEYDTVETSAILTLLARAHCDSLENEELRGRLNSALNRQDFAYLCALEVDPSTLTISDYRNVRQILAFFQKRVDIDIGVSDKSAVAWETFIEAERLCRETNEIFRSYSRGGFYFHPRVESVLYVAQRKISRILGDLPSLSDLKLRFGPGATTQVKKREASVRRKLAQKFACSEVAVGLLPEILAEMPDWAQVPNLDHLSTICDVSLERGRVDFVRKSAKTDRTISVEPMLNGMVQLAIGDHIAACLRREGVDLRDQTLNQRLAREGSITGALATLDLSSASDTVACGLVESLLPLEWWDFLRQLRTPVVETPSGPLRLEKFSTMGNGFTFALESLLFYALASAAKELSGSLGPVSVYGDDIIVPTEVDPLLREVLASCGFKVNARKSFSSGPFRESCGKDYYSGISVRPCYIKDALTGHTLFILHNFYVREGLDGYAQLVRQFISDDLAIYGPDGFGDGHLLGDSPLTPHNRAIGWAGFTFETYTYKANRVFYKKPLSADYVFPSYSIYISSNEDIDGAIFPTGKGTRRIEGMSSHRPHGLVRPDNSQSIYRRGLLEDVLPGIRGYKRIKIYTLKQ